MKTLSVTLLFLISLCFFAGTARAQAVEPTSQLTIEPIPDQIIFAGRRRMVPLPLPTGLGQSAQAELVEAPGFVKLEMTDSGIRLLIAPALDEAEGGRVTVRVSLESGFSTETSFQITVLPELIIGRVEYVYPHLSITGSGFDPAGSRVLINAKDCSRYIIAQTTRTIRLLGDKRLLNLSPGLNWVEVRSGQARQIFLIAGLIATQSWPRSISPLDSVENIQVEVGSPITINLSIKDDNGPVTVDLKCDRGNFVTLSGTQLTINPTIADLGLTTCTVKATDSVGLSNTITFFINVVPCATPIMFNSVGDQVVKTGEVRTIEIRVNDSCGLLPVKLSLISSPNFVTFSDRGDGTGTLRIAPTSSDTGGRVVIEAIDAIGLLALLNFNVAIQLTGAISSVTFVKPNLFIAGNGFGVSGAQIFINNQNVSMRILAQSDTSVTLRGSKKKLNLKSGPNLIRLIPGAGGGKEALEFVLNL